MTELTAAADAARAALTRVLATHCRSHFHVDGSIDGELDPDTRREIEAEVTELCDVIAALSHCGRVALVRAHWLLLRWSEVAAASGAGDVHRVIPAITAVERALQPSAEVAQ